MRIKQNSSPTPPKKPKKQQNPKHILGQVGIFEYTPDFRWYYGITIKYLRYGINVVVKWEENTLTSKVAKLFRDF